MKLKIGTENLMERIALVFNFVPKPIIHTQVALISARAIISAADLGVFESIGKLKKSAEQVACSIKADEIATKNLLDCLVGIGYLCWHNHLYSIRPRYYKWLLREYPSNLIAKLRFEVSEWNWMSKLENYVLTARPIDIHAVMTKEEWKQYQDSMQSLSINMAKELARKIPVPEHATQMLDIGGSHGLYSIELCKKYPLMSATILELHGAIDEASRIASKYKLTDRVKYKEGNAITDDLGKDKYDLILINNVVHHFTNEENQLLAKKIKRALKPHGILGVGELIRLDKPGKGGVAAATAGLYFSLTSSSGTWSLEEIRSWQKNAGLKISKSFGMWTLPGWRMVIAKKEDQKEN
jgi:2-polyprenyl-3-methyl-5-hydroxy-6-metoxy-1,4-benzoquinol methylase